MHVTLRDKWTDPRLRFTDKAVDSVTMIDPTKIWVPDTFIVNSVKEEAGGLSSSNHFMRVDANGEVIKSRR